MVYHRPMRVLHDEKEECMSEKPDMPEVIIVSGMSGAGRTEAMHALEDLGAGC